MSDNHEEVFPPSSPCFCRYRMTTLPFSVLPASTKDVTEKAGQLHWIKVNKPGTANDLTRVEGDTDGNGKPDFKLELPRMTDHGTS